MAEFKAYKVVARLPENLEPNTTYWVRTGEGFDLYLSDSTGSYAHKLNTPNLASVIDSTPNNVLQLKENKLYIPKKKVYSMPNLVTQDEDWAMRLVTGYTYNIDASIDDSVWTIKYALCRISSGDVVHRETFGNFDKSLSDFYHYEIPPVPSY